MDTKLVDTSSKEVVPKYRISFTPESDSSEDPVDFEIINNTVVPQDNFISSFKVLGAAFQGSYYVGSKLTYYDRMVTSRLEVGNETFYPWGNYNLPVSSNINDGSTHSWTLPTTYSAGTSVKVTGRGWDRRQVTGLNYNLDSSWKSTSIISSGSPKLKVLRNGDDVPNISGSMNQDSIAYFVADYVDENGKIVLEDNEAIFLFELGVSDDFQDLVVLMTMEPAPAS